MQFHAGIFRTMPAAAAAVAIAGCAGSLEQIQNETLLPEIDVVQVKENADEALKLSQEAKLDVEVLSTKMTEFDSKLIMLSDEVSDVSLAKIEEIELRLSLLIEAFKDLQELVNAIEVMPRVRVVKKKKAPPPSFSVAPPEYGDYSNCLRVFNSRSYKKAIELFSNHMKKFPRSKYLDNCHYWIGESFYSLGDYAHAVASYKKVFETEHSSKADDAQLRIGLSYLRLGQFGRAKAELRRLIDRYPASPLAGKARKYLAEME